MQHDYKWGASMKINNNQSPFRQEEGYKELISYTQIDLNNK